MFFAFQKCKKDGLFPLLPKPKSSQEALLSPNFKISEKKHSKSVGKSSCKSKGNSPVKANETLV